MSKRFIIAGNWKMHKTAAESRAFLAALAEHAPRWSDVEVVVFPPFTALAALQAPPNIRIGAQNMHHEEQGAFTGEVAPAMVKEWAQYVLIGHSERRHIFGENDEGVNRKIGAALRHGLHPMVCIGETLAERERGDTFAVLEGQLRGGLAGFSPAEVQRLVIAYEPVWAIGTGRNATPEQAQEVHAFIRGFLQAQWSGAGSVPLLYGGSVKPENARDLLACPDIDGLLIGGASLKPDSFSVIIETSLTM